MSQPAAWRVALSPPAPDDVARLLRLLPGWFGIEASNAEYVDPSRHRDGAGRALVAALEADLIADGTAFLQVKTQGPAYPDPGYQRTRQFYAAVGFQPLEEFTASGPASRA
jgi:GNAT superfamily N-acetyltransferase